MEGKVPGHLCLYHLHKCLLRPPLSAEAQGEATSQAASSHLSEGVRLPSLVEGKNEALGRAAPAQAASLRAAHRSLTVFLNGRSLVPAPTQCRGEEGTPRAHADVPLSRCHLRPPRSVASSPRSLSCSRFPYAQPRTALDADCWKGNSVHPAAGIHSRHRGRSCELEGRVLASRASVPVGEQTANVSADERPTKQH